MTYALTAEQLEIREAVSRLCQRFGDDYWLKKDEEGGFPHEFHRAMAEAGWLGIAMPEAYGGSGLGITEAAVLMQAVAEPGAGLDTTRLKTRALREGDHYVLSGRKIWISTAQVAEKMLILARTTPLEEVARPSLGMTLFYTDLDRNT